jgi:hypothetical protein
MSASLTANKAVTEKLNELCKDVEQKFAADCLCFAGPITFGVDDAIRDAVEDLSQRRERAKREKLLFILETTGGYAETALRISDAIRHHYKTVDFLIPGFAMSAGTILVMSGDSIHMDYYSVLGPIDPQVEGSDGSLVPALGYLIRYQDLLRKANQGKISTAEMQLLLAFDQTTLYAYEQARDLSRTLLEDWLAKYKFKDWEKTETRMIRVTDAMRRKRAKEVADKLNDVKKWNSHGLGISMEKLRTELKLKIDDFGQDPEVHRLIRGYHGLFTDFMVKMGHKCAVHTRFKYRSLAS